MLEKTLLNREMVMKLRESDDTQTMESGNLSEENDAAAISGGHVIGVISEEN